MRLNLDDIQIALWCITYILIIIFEFKNFHKKILAIPIVAIMLNFSWEVNVLYNSRGFWGHIAWTVLDLIILIYAIICLKNNIQRVKFTVLLILLIIILRIIFIFPRGILLSVFAIDLVMSATFWIDKRKLLSEGKISIAITKLLGDLVAAIYYYHHSIFVAICGVLVLIFNTMYLVYCIKEKGGAYARNNKT